MVSIYTSVSGKNNELDIFHYKQKCFSFVRPDAWNSLQLRFKRLILLVIISDTEMYYIV